jgi:hypothetical protein
MNVQQLTPIIVALYNAATTGMLSGPPGIGKSASFRAAAEQLRDLLGLKGPVLERHQIAGYVAQGGDINQAFGMFDVRLGQSDPVDIGGLPREDKATGSMERLVPGWFPHEGRTDLPRYGILLLDEFPSAPLSVQTAAYQITLDGVIDKYRLKDGWRTFAAGNRLMDGGQFFKMPHAQANRMCHISVESDLDSWLNWAIDNDIEHSLVGFMRLRPDLLNTYDDHIGQGADGKKKQGAAFATERMWEKVNDYLVGNPAAPDEVTTAVISGMIGEGAAAEYIGFRQTWHNMPDVNQVLVDPDSAPLPEDSATQFAICTALAARVDMHNVGQALKYMDRFLAKQREELVVMFAKDMQRRQSVAQKKAHEAGNNQFVRAEQTQAYSIWSQRNADLF